MVQQRLIPRAVQAWRRYVQALVAAEISATTRFGDLCVQLRPLPHDDGGLLSAIDCRAKITVDALANLPTRKGRIAILLNGNFNYLSDAQADLTQLHQLLDRHARVFVVLYNPFLGGLYELAGRLRLRDHPCPDTLLTEHGLRIMTRLTGFEIVKIRPCAFLPMPAAGLGRIANRILPAVPLVRRMALTWVVALRPIRVEAQRPSLSVIVPARNEAGNLEALLARMPNIGGGHVEIIFVEGHSTDDTWRRLQAIASQKHPRFRIKTLQQPGRGKNDAVRAGVAQATGELIAILDADLTMPPEMLPRFYEAYRQGHGDFINGNRLVYPMEHSAMRPLNRLANVLFAKALSFVLGIEVGDVLCGTKLLPRLDYERLAAWRERFGDFDPFGDFELLFAASELGLGVCDLPIRYRARKYGTTNIHRFADGLALARMTWHGLTRLKLGRTHVPTR